MKVTFMRTHISAELPIQTPRGLGLVALDIVDNGDHKLHKYGLRVKIPQHYIGLLLPVPSIIDKIEKVGCLGIISPEDSLDEITVAYALPDDMVHDYYQVGEVTALLVIIPAVEIETELVFDYV